MLFCPPQKIVDENPTIGVARNYDELLAGIRKTIAQCRWKALGKKKANLSVRSPIFQKPKQWAIVAIASTAAITNTARPVIFIKSGAGIRNAFIIHFTSFCLRICFQKTRYTLLIYGIFPHKVKSCSANLQKPLKHNIKSQNRTLLSRVGSLQTSISKTFFFF